MAGQGPHMGPGAKPKKSKVLRSAMRRLLPGLGLLALFSIFTNLLRLTIPLYLLQVVDRVISSESQDTLIYITLIAVAALLTGAVLMIIGKIMQNRIGSWLENRLFEPVVKASVLGRPTGRSFGPKSARDLSLLRNFFSGQAITTLLEAPWTPVFIAIIFFLHPQLGLLSVAVALALLVLAVLNDTLTAGHQTEVQKIQAKVGHGIQQALMNVDAARSMGMLPRLINTLKVSSDASARSLDSVNERSAFFTGAIRFVRSLAQVTVLGFGAYLVLKGEITTGTMIAASILQSLALTPVDQAVGALRAIKGAVGAFRGVEKQLAAIETTEDELHLEKNESLSITLRQAMFMPARAAKPVLRPIRLDLPGGEMLGILGPSAAGKTTLCRLLIGAVPASSGSVLINGLDVKRLMGEEFGLQVGYIPQMPMPLGGTIADNIARFRPQDDPRRSADVVEAAKLVGAHELTLALPRRYDTVLDEEGMELLSRSQLQRLFLARALYGKPRLLVLDEPTTFLDKEGEAMFYKALETMREAGTTIIAVSQRPQFLKACDKLLLLRDGNMIDFGEPARVLKNLSEAPNKQFQARLVDGGRRNGTTR